MEVDQELVPPEDELEEYMILVKEEDEDDEVGIEVNLDSPEIVYSGEYSKQDEEFQSKEDPDSPEIKREDEDDEIEIIEIPDSPEIMHSEEYSWLKDENDKPEITVIPDSPEIKYSNTQDYLDIGETLISQPTTASASISTEMDPGEGKRRSRAKQMEDPEKREEILRKAKERCGKWRLKAKEKIKLNPELGKLWGEKERTKKKRYREKKKAEKAVGNTEAINQSINHSSFVTTENKNGTEGRKEKSKEKPFYNICDARHTYQQTEPTINKQNNTPTKHLTIHLTTHTGEKLFVCEACNYRCAKHTQLRKHMIVHHTCEKPIKCAACDSCYKTRKGLKAHIKRTHPTHAPSFLYHHKMLSVSEKSSPERVKKGDELWTLLDI